MEFFSFFDALGNWQFIFPLLLIVFVFIAIWHSLGNTSKSSAELRFLKAMLLSGFAFFVLALFLLGTGFLALQTDSQNHHKSGPISSGPCLA
jgi:hypothetical protein